MLINRETGQPPTPAEQITIDRRAIEILRSPYSSPEQVAWALDVAPPDFELVFWESCQQAAISRRRRANA